MEYQIQTSTIRTMNNPINIQKAIVIGLILFGIITLISGIIRGAWYLYFMGITEILLGTLMYDNNEI